MGWDQTREGTGQELCRKGSKATSVRTVIEALEGGGNPDHRRKWVPELLQLSFWSYEPSPRSFDD